MTDIPDEMAQPRDENAAAVDHGLSVEDVAGVDQQLVEALRGSGKPEGYTDVLAHEDEQRKRRPFIKGIGVVAITTVVFAGVSYVVKHRASEQK